MNPDERVPVICIANLDPPILFDPKGYGWIVSFKRIVAWLLFLVLQLISICLPLPNMSLERCHVVCGVRLESIVRFQPHSAVLEHASAPLDDGDHPGC